MLDIARPGRSSLRKGDYWQSALVCSIWRSLLVSYSQDQACKFAHSAGLLTSGIIPSMRHAVQNLMADDMIVLPATATVFVQAVEIRFDDVCGVNMTPANQYRWHPTHLAGEWLLDIFPPSASISPQNVMKDLHPLVWWESGAQRFEQAHYWTSCYLGRIKYVWSTFHCAKHFLLWSSNMGASQRTKLWQGRVGFWGGGGGGGG